MLGEPRNLANSDSSDGKLDGGASVDNYGFVDTGYPPLDDFVEAQQEIEEDSILWLSYCKELARRRVPPTCFDQVPPDIWRFKVSGSKVVIMRTPQIEQQGSIIIPNASQKQNEVGWILTVGPRIHNTEEPNIRGREYGYSHYGNLSPLLAVGDLVLFNKHAGQALVSSLIDEGVIHRSKAQQFLLISIADVFGPLVQVRKSDWATVQEEVVVGGPTTTSKVVLA